MQDKIQGVDPNETVLAAHRSAIQPWLVTSVEGCDPAQSVNGHNSATTRKVDVVQRGLRRPVRELPLEMVSSHHGEGILNVHGQFVLQRDEG